MTENPDGLARRAHPFTGPTITVALTFLVFLIPAPTGPLLLYGGTVVAVVLGGVGRSVRQGLLVCLPLWVFLLLLHGVLGPSPRLSVGPISLSESGWAAALSQGARLGAIITASLGMYHSFRPSRFVDAVAERGWPFSVAYLFVATLLAVPRFIKQARSIQEAQRARGLRVSGGLVRRLRGLRALALPLLFGALAEVEDRTFALETRAASGRRTRTALAPVPDGLWDRALRWTAVSVVVLAVAWRIFR